MSYTSQTNGLKLQGEDFNNGTVKQTNIPTLAPGYSSISLGKLEFGTNQAAQIKFDITLAASVITSQTKNILPLDIKLIFSQLAYDPTQHALIYNIKNEGLDVAQHIKFSYHNISTAAAEQQVTLNGVREQEIIISDLASNMETSAQTLSADFKGQKQATFLCKLWYANTLVVEQNIKLENEINGNMIYEALENDDFEQALKMIQQAPLDAINYAHPGNRQHTLLMKAILKDRKDIVEALIHQGVNIHTQNKQGVTALMFAAATSTKDIAEVLVNHGADVHAKDQDGETALIHAVSFGELEIAAFLSDKGAHIDHKANNGDTPLTMAIKGSHSSVVEFLLQKGADVNIPDANGNTPLMLAIKSDKVDMVKLLLISKSKLYTSNNVGETALTLAQSKPEIKELLEKHIATHP